MTAFFEDEDITLADKVKDISAEGGQFTNYIKEQFDELLKI